MFYKFDTIDKRTRINITIAQKMDDPVFNYANVFDYFDVFYYANVFDYDDVFDYANVFDQPTT